MNNEYHQILRENRKAMIEDNVDKLVDMFDSRYKISSPGWDTIMARMFFEWDSVAKEQTRSDLEEWKEKGETE